MNDGPLAGISQRSRPTNLPAEQGLLGAIMANPKAFDRVDGMLEVHHFADPVHGFLFESAARRIRAGGIADMITLAGEFGPSGLLAPVGGVPYLATLLAGLVSPSLAGEYGKAIVDAWARREIIEAAESMVAKAFDSGDVSALLAGSAAAVEAVALGAAMTGGRSKAKSLGEAIDAALAQADAVLRGEGTSGVMTGMSTIDTALGGMENGDLVVLGGRPGSGKSSLAWQWAIDVARRGGGVLAVSMEMTASALGRRALSIASGVPIWRMKKAQHEEDMGPLLAARRELLMLPLSIEDGGRTTSAEMFGMARAARRKHGLSMIVVDHLQIAKPDDQDQRNGSTAAVAGVAHAMKELAKRMECPVVLLSQLNRALESRDDHRPTMADLRQAGAIEEDADIVAFVYRPELHMAKSAPEQTDRETGEKYQERVNAWHARKAKNAGAAEFIIEKLRDGETTMVPLLFDGPTTTFRQRAETE